MRIDCTIFSGEIELLRLRLTELANVIDVHIIIECAWTFTNKHRGLHLLEHLEKIQLYVHKIVYIPILSYPEHLSQIDISARDRETYIRNYPLKYLRDNYDGDDVVVVCDLDEIPNPETLRKFKYKGGIYSLEMDMYYYNLQCYIGKWSFAYMCNLSLLYDMDKQRMSEALHARIANAGWHLSYFMTPKQIAQKLRSFSHTEFGTDYYTDIERIRERISEKVSILYPEGSTLIMESPTPDMIMPKNAYLLPIEFQ